MTAPLHEPGVMHTVLNLCTDSSRPSMRTWSSLRRQHLSFRISHACLSLPVTCTQGMALALGTMQLLTEKGMTGKGEFQNAAPNGPTWNHGFMDS